MRSISPFDYFLKHASAIDGFGGERRSPDPRYCFHTLYVDVRPGRARYILKLDGAQATGGELTVRVHAFRHPPEGVPSLVAGSRLALATDGPQNLTCEVQFIALPNVRYALYGFFSEPADIDVAHVSVEIDEPEEWANLYTEPPRSALASNETESDHRPANALIHHGPVSSDHPVCQNCTLSQIDAAYAAQNGVNAALARWAEMICLNALAAYGIGYAGIDVAVPAAISPLMAEGVAPRHFNLKPLDAGGGGLADGEYADIILWPAGFPPENGQRERWEQVRNLLERLKLGGWAVLVAQYAPSVETESSSSAAEATGLSRNELSQWTLRLMAEGFSVAPLAFAPLDELVLNTDGLASFAMIVSRQ